MNLYKKLIVVLFAVAVLCSPRNTVAQGANVTKINVSTPMTLFFANICDPAEGDITVTGDLKFFLVTTQNKNGTKTTGFQSFRGFGISEQGSVYIVSFYTSMGIGFQLPHTSVIQLQLISMGQGPNLVANSVILFDKNGAATILGGGPRLPGKLITPLVE